MSNVQRPPILGEPGYSHAHYWRHDAPKCGLPTNVGACQWPQEPGMPWCNSHLGSYLVRMKEGGYTMENCRAYFAGLGWNEVALATVCARYERLLGASQKPATPPEAPEAPPEPERVAEANVEAPRRKPRGL